MESFAVIVNDSDEFSSFEIEESVIGDPADLLNESVKSTRHDNATEKSSTTTETDNNNKSSTLNQRQLAQPANVSINTTNYRSPLNDSNESLASDSDVVVLSSDDEEDSRTTTESLSFETAKTDNESSVSSGNTESQYKEVTKVPSSDEESQYKEVTKVPSSDEESQFEEVTKVPSSDEESQYKEVTKVPSSDEESQYKEVTKMRSSNEKSQFEEVTKVPSSDEKSQFEEVTKAEYDAHVAKIKDISERINQTEMLLRLKSQLPDKGDKLKQLLARLRSELDDKKNTLQNLKIKEPSDLELDFKNLSINESENEQQEERTNEQEITIEWSFDNTDTISRLFDKIKLSEKSMPNENTFAEQPRLINGKLMPHQKRALAWMIWRENQFPSGGILGDDMGLGKTLTMISLIARHIEMRGSKPQETRNERNERPEQDESDWNGRTLVVCPASVIRQWEAEIDKFTNFAIRVCLHHGDKRSDSPEELTTYEVVITTYGLVRTEIEKNGALSQIHWERIILDEAHTIRNYSSKQSLTCCRLKGTKRWALTGTPIQNKHGDVYALIKFLKCSPLDEFRKWKYWTNKKPELRISNLLKFLLLRRTKAELGKIGEISSLPEKTLQVIPVQLTSAEMNVYETVSSFSKILSEQFRHQRNPNRNVQPPKNARIREDIQKALDFFTISGSISTSHILLVILRLRQICIHPNLIDAMLMEEDISDISGVTNMLEELNELTMGGTNADQKLQRSNPVFDPHSPSSKFDCVLRTLKTKVIDRQEKAVVVSQFTSVLKLFATHLTSHQIKYLVLTGSTKITHRQNVVQSFNDDPDEQILLLSLTAGGVGLNLCGANNLFFIDPHWNPQLESQAEDRVYRIGQTKPVTIYRFICEGTIEERIQNLQEQKKGVAKNILSGYKLNIDEMMALI